MNRETLEQAVTDYAASVKPSFVTGEFDRYAIADAFESGAHWRINSVWHDGTVSCKARRKALVLFKNGNAAVYKDLRDLSYEMLWDEVERFAYIDDLLPEKKETSNE